MIVGAPGQLAGAAEAPQWAFCSQGPPQLFPIITEPKGSAPTLSIFKPSAQGWAENAFPVGLCYGICPPPDPLCGPSDGEPLLQPFHTTSQTESRQVTVGHNVVFHF